MSRLCSEEGDEEAVTFLRDCDIFKRTLCKGNLDSWPVDGFECFITVDGVEFNGQNGPCAVDEHSKYFKDFSGAIVIGEADCFIDMELENCIRTMCSGEKSAFRMNYNNVHGTMVKEVKCIVFLKSVKLVLPVALWPWSDLQQKAVSLKQIGVELIKQNRIADAFRKFGHAIKYILTIDENDVNYCSIPDLIELKIKLMNNLAHCQLHYQEYNATIKLCNQVLIYENNNSKALFRRGSAHMELENWEEAHTDMEKVVRMNPDDPKARWKLAELKKKKNVIDNEYKNTIKKMFA